MKRVRTCDGTEKPEGWRLSAVGVDHALAGGRGHGDGQRDGLVELSTSRLNRDYRRHRHTVAQKFSRQLRRYRLRLFKRKTNQNKVKIK